MTKHFNMKDRSINELVEQAKKDKSLAVYIYEHKNDFYYRVEKEEKSEAERRWSEALNWGHEYGSPSYGDIDKIYSSYMHEIVNAHEELVDRMNKDIARAQYQQAISMLGEYIGRVCLPGNLSSGSRLIRFFTGAWNRTNVHPVDSLLKKHDPSGRDIGLKEGSVSQLLEDLKSNLLSEGKTINPKGTLAQCIQKIQKENDLNLIDINELNSMIESNVLVSQIN